MKWNNVSDKLPKERRFVLWQFAGNIDRGKPPSVVVGYLRYAAGDKDSPQVIVPGCHPGTLPMYWADCLGKDFKPPLWNNNK